jgi:hypothetical protein
MTLLGVCTVLLVIIAVVATVFLARAAVAIVQMREQVVSLRKQAKEVLTLVSRTNVSAQRILERQYKHQDATSELHRQVEIILTEPKVQAVLNKSRRES